MRRRRGEKGGKLTIASSRTAWDGPSHQLENHLSPPAQFVCVLFSFISAAPAAPDEPGSFGSDESFFPFVSL